MKWKIKNVWNHQPVMIWYCYCIPISTSCRCRISTLSWSEGLAPPIFLALLEGLRRQSHAALLAAGANGEMTGEKCRLQSHLCYINTSAKMKVNKRIPLRILCKSIWYIDVWCVHVFARICVNMHLGGCFGIRGVQRYFDMFIFGNFGSLELSMKLQCFIRLWQMCRP